MNEGLSSEENIAGEWVVDRWINSWTRSIDGSWIACEGVMAPSVGMIKFSPQVNGWSTDARAGNSSGVPAYLESSSLNVSDKIIEEGVMDEDGGELRFGTIPKF